MLRLLSGRTHQVITGVSLLSATILECTEAEVTEVAFVRMSEQEIAEYVASGEPMDKAGAYGIQGMASRWVERIWKATTSMWWDFRWRECIGC